MDRGRLSRGCLLALLLTALILCSRPHGAEGQDPDPGESIVEAVKRLQLAASITNWFWGVARGVSTITVCIQ